MLKVHKGGCRRRQALRAISLYCSHSLRSAGRAGGVTRLRQYQTTFFHMRMWRGVPASPGRGDALSSRSRRNTASPFRRFSILITQTGSHVSGKASRGHSTTCPGTGPTRKLLVVPSWDLMSSSSSVAEGGRTGISPSACAPTIDGPLGSVGKGGETGEPGRPVDSRDGRLKSPVKNRECLAKMASPDLASRAILDSDGRPLGKTKYSKA